MFEASGSFPNRTTVSKPGLQTLNRLRLKVWKPFFNINNIDFKYFLRVYFENVWKMYTKMLQPPQNFQTFVVATSTLAQVGGFAQKLF